MQFTLLHGRRPPIFFGRPLFSTFRQIAKKWTKNQSVYAASNYGIRAAVRRVEMWPLTDKISSENIFSSPNIVCSMNNNWRIKFQIKDSFINFLLKQALYPFIVTKSDFSDFGWSFEHRFSETNSVTPQFFYIFDISNP